MQKISCALADDVEKDAMAPAGPFGGFTNLLLVMHPTVAVSELNKTKDSVKSLCGSTVAQQP